MLEVVTVPVSTGTVDCWMDIQRGEFPNVSAHILCYGAGTPALILNPIISATKLSDCAVCVSLTLGRRGFKSYSKHEYQHFSMLVQELYVVPITKQNLNRSEGMILKETEKELIWMSYINEWCLFVCMNKQLKEIQGEILKKLLFHTE